MTEKRCTKCGVIQTPENTYMRRRPTPSLLSECMSCTKDRNYKTTIRSRYTKEELYERLESLRHNISLVEEVLAEMEVKEMDEELGL